MAAVPAVAAVPTVTTIPAVTTIQPMPTSTVIVQQPQRRKPENYMVFSVLVTFFCNCPLGMLAWIFSCLSDTSYNEGWSSYFFFFLFSFYKCSYYEHFFVTFEF